MLRALLIALGVDLAVVVVVAAFVFGRRRWLKRQPGEFAGAIRVPAGVVEGLRPKWKRGSGALGPRRPGLEQGAVDVPQ